MKEKIPFRRFTPSGERNLNGAGRLIRPESMGAPEAARGGFGSE